MIKTKSLAVLLGASLLVFGASTSFAADPATPAEKSADRQEARQNTRSDRQAGREKARASRQTGRQDARADRADRKDDAPK